ncbi:MAG TPA: phosphoribosylformylglycinamidine synthase subunit PurQ [Chroococcales cyanobacterium]|jgi:phosphoribosylformylglycinamidine synthase
MVRALVLTGYGINCEGEMAHGFRLAGAEATILHLEDLIERPENLRTFHIFALPGGFSFGDHLGSGRALANRLRHSPLWKELLRFIEEGKYVWGVCNGFQTLIKLGLLPGETSLIRNESNRFENRWVDLLVDPCSPSVYTEGLGTLNLPVRHGEGRLFAGDETIRKLIEKGYAVLRYLDAEGKETEEYPFNPNGSPCGIAGLCDPSGRIFGLMPHPEAFLDFTNHPHWTRSLSRLRREGKAIPKAGEGLALFNNVVRKADGAFK